MSCVLDNLWKRPLVRNGLVWCLLLVLGRSPVFADQSVTLTWNPSPDATAVGYKIYYGGASRVYTNTLPTSTTAAVTISGLSEGATYYFSATTVSSSGAESDFSNEATYIIPASANTNSIPVGTIPPVYTPPTLDAIANLSLFQNSGPQTVTLTGIGTGSGIENPTLVVSAVSSDSSIVSNPTVSYISPATSGSLTFTPNAIGSATVTVTVDNGAPSNNIVSQAFTVTVAAAPVLNNQPSVDAVNNLTVYQNAGVQTVALTGISAGAAGQTVTIWAYTSDATIIPAPAVNYSSPNSTGSLSFAPAANVLGSSTITIKVNNGVNNITRDFRITVVPAPQVEQPPTLDGLTNMTIYQNSGVQTVVLTSVVSKSVAQSEGLTISAVSSDPNIIPAPTVDYSSPNNLGTLTFAPSTNAVGSATVTVTAAIGTNAVVRVFTVTVLPVAAVVTGNQAPTLNPIADIVAPQYSSSKTVTLTGIGSGSPTEKQKLKVSATSSNPRLVASPTIRYTSPASTATLTLRPMGGATGTAIITVTVNDGSKSNNIVTQTFSVTLVPNQAPTLDVIPDITISQDSLPQTIVLTGITSGSPTEKQVLKISALSSNPRLVSMPSIRYSSPSNTALLTFKPTGKTIGTSIITVTVNDGSRSSNTIRQRFTVTVTAPVISDVIASVASALSIKASAMLQPVVLSAVAEPAVGIGQDVAATLTTLSTVPGQFSFQVTGVPGAAYVVQATTDLNNWTPVSTNTAPFIYQDNATGGSNQRFYRAVYAQQN